MPRDPELSSVTTTSTNDAYGNKQEKSWVVEPFQPDSEVDWSQHSTKRSLWRYEDKTVEEEFERFYFRDQTPFPLAFAFTIGTLLVPFADALTGNSDISNIFSSVFGVYVFPTSIFWLGGLIADQILFFAVDGATTKWRATARQVISVMFAYGVVHNCSWYEVFYCSDAFDTEAERIRYCTEAMDAWIYLPYSGALFLTTKCKLHHQVFLLFLTFFVTLLGSIPWHDVYFTHGGRHKAVVVLYQMFGLFQALAIAVCRWLTVQRQFEQAITVSIAQRAALDRQLLVNTLLESLVPGSVLSRMLTDPDVPVVDGTGHASVLFSDVASFTHWSSSRSALEVVSMLNTLVTEFDEAAKDLGGVERVKTIGDAYWAVTGLPEPMPDHAETLCDFGLKMLAIVSESNKSHPEWAKHSKYNGVQLRIGIHSGALSGAVLGTKQVTYEVFGETNTIASLAEQNGEPGYVAVTETTVDCCAEGHIDYTNFPSAPADPKMMTIPGTDGATLRLYLLRPLGSGDERSPQQDGGGVSPGFGGYKQTRGGVLGASNNLANSLMSSKHRSGPSERRSNYSQGSHHHKEFKAMTGEEKKKEEARRERFLAQQRMKRGELEDDRDQHESWTLESLKFLNRKFRFCCMGLDHDQGEAQYQGFVQEQMKQVRVAARIGSTSLFALLIIMALIDGRSIGVPAYILFVLALIASIPPLVICTVKNVQYPLADLILSIVAHFLALMAALVATLGKNDETVNIVVNDPAIYCVFALLPIAMCTPTPIGAMPLQLICFLFFGLPTLGALMVLSDPRLGSDGVLILLVIFATALYCYITERVYRRTFYEKRLAEFLQGERERHMRSAEGVLATMVPKHVTAPLLDWISHGMISEKSISRDYDNICIAFILLKQPRDLSNDPLSISCQQDQQEKPIVLGLNGSNNLNTSNSAGRNSAGDAVVQFAGSASLNGSSASASSPGGAALGQSTSLQASQAYSPKQEEEGLWMQKAHQLVDEELGRYESLTKIKTVGELVMIAGPFISPADAEKMNEAADDAEDSKIANLDDPNHNQPLSLSTSVKKKKRVKGFTGEVAALEMMKAVTALRDNLGLSVQAGLHSGPVMTAVLGTSRPTFDVFGDTVNTTSRVMSTSPKESGYETGEDGKRSSSIISATPEFISKLAAAAPAEAVQVVEPPRTTSILRHPAAETRTPPPGGADKTTSNERTATTTTGGERDSLPGAIESSPENPESSTFEIQVCATGDQQNEPTPNASSSNLSIKIPVDSSSFPVTTATPPVVTSGRGARPAAWESDAVAGMKFGPVEERTAKGKGVLLARQAHAWVSI